MIAWHARFATLIVAATVGIDGGLFVCADEPLDFNRDIRPILSRRCFACHGPDEDSRMGGGEQGLRLDTPAGALADLGGVAAIVPGKPEDSELVSRITSTDEYERMPPLDSGDQLDDAEVQLIIRWIRSGASYAKHWAYARPLRPALPVVTNTAWPRNPVDHFILSRLEREGLRPSPEADRYTLIRRLSIDLIGLPPTPEEADEFVADPRENAYEALVDRLLGKAAFGECWGSKWLDLARYADSAGYADDPPRTIWAYRDWVIRAFNENMPFDQFTIEQIAGDLLPNPTDQQLIATAFHRNTPTNNEGGTNDEEFRNVAVVDRVNTTMSVWMGTTMGCAQCHSHKYDPITQEEYFQFFAILNNTQDTDQKDERPTLSTFTATQARRRGELQQQIGKAQEALAAIVNADASIMPRSDGPLPVQFVRIELPGDSKLLSLAEVQVFRGTENIAVGKTAIQSSVDYDGTAARAVDGNTDGHYFNAKSTTHTTQESDPWWEVDLGQEDLIDRIVVWNRTDSPQVGRRLDGFRIVLLDSSRQPLFVKVIAPAPTTMVAIDIPHDVAELQVEARSELGKYRRENSPQVQAARQQIVALQKQLEAITLLTTPILRELPEEKRRQTFVQYRGSYQDLGKQVTGDVPAALKSANTGQTTTRLALARWLVDDQNPLTARVAVNRYWEQLFGVGLVSTSEDFGSQGDLPSHPELLDWLATEFVASGWDRKKIVRMLVTSATYRQSSQVSEKLLDIDPDNRLLARGPRFRVAAEVVRDQSLFASGLLSDKMFGPPVRPPQPSLGLKAAFGGGIDWKTSEGEDRYRRAIYTTWRRSNPYPSMVTFGAPHRAVCTVRRSRTNTPLQALVTMNDPVFVEAAQALARRISAHEGSVADRIQLGFRICLTRAPSAPEIASLQRLYQQTLEWYSHDLTAARKLATDPLGPIAVGEDPVELAAWTTVGNVLLNLDEMLMKR
jgi:hypothetical protein